VELASRVETACSSSVESWRPNLTVDIDVISVSPLPNVRILQSFSNNAGEKTDLSFAEVRTNFNILKLIYYFNNLFAIPVQEWKYSSSCA
jgi:hypothetical protein